MLNVEQKLKYIITAFEIYALGDISNVRKHKMPIAAFILGFCFIDQVSGFVYDNTKRARKLILIDQKNSYLIILIRLL